MVNLGLGNAQFGTLCLLISSGSLDRVSIISSTKKASPRTKDALITVYDHEILENIWTLLDTVSIQQHKKYDQRLNLARSSFAVDIFRNQFYLMQQALIPIRKLLVIPKTIMTLLYHQAFLDNIETILAHRIHNQVKVYTLSPKKPV